MIKLFHNITSLNNLHKNKTKCGQIATLLILMIVAILIFVMVTVNIGQVSVTTTVLANAVDSGALYLASQLSTKAAYLIDTLRHQGSGSYSDNPPQRCKKGGLLGIILAIALAVLAIVTFQYWIAPAYGAIGSGMFALSVGAAGSGAATFTGTVVAGALGGMIGGAIGGGIVSESFTGALTGAITGLMLGAAIGAAWGFASAVWAGPGGASLSTPASSQLIGQAAGAPATGATVGGGTAGSAVGLGSGGLIGTAAESAMTGAIVPQMTFPAFTQIPQALWGVAGLSGVTGLGWGTTGGAAAVALVGGAKIYTESVKESETAAAFSAAARALNGLPEYDRIREGVFLQVLSQTIDDPNRALDVYDLNGNGDTSDTVTAFQNRWHERIKKIERIIPDLQALTREFINEDLENFENTARSQYETEPANLSRKEAGGKDGVIVELARALQQAGYNVSFFKPGIPQSPESCPTCQEYEYYDQVEAVVSELNDLVEIAKGLRGEESPEGVPDISKLTSSWQSWINWFYDPDSTDDYYDTLNILVNGDESFRGLRGWRDEISALRATLDICYYGEENAGICESCSACANNCITNPPCQTSVDEDLLDEFDASLQAINGLISDIEAFRQAAKAYYEAMQDTYKKIDLSGGELTGVNPIRYSWKDSRGDHWIEAQVGPFRLASIRTRKYGNFLKNKICLEVINYQDNGANSWVSVTRQGPSDKPMGKNMGQTRNVLGWWNPGNSGKITKRIGGSYIYTGGGTYNLGLRK